MGSEGWPVRPAWWVVAQLGRWLAGPEPSGRGGSPLFFCVSLFFYFISFLFYFSFSKNYP